MHPDILLPEINKTIKVNANKNHVWHLFVVRYKERDRLQQYLNKNGVQTLIHYPIPPHKQRAYAEWNELEYPITEQIHTEVLSLPISPIISEREVQQVVEAIHSFK